MRERQTHKTLAGTEANGLSRQQIDTLLTGFSTCSQQLQLIAQPLHAYDENPEDLKIHSLDEFIRQVKNNAVLQPQSIPYNWQSSRSA